MVRYCSLAVAKAAAGDVKSASWRKQFPSLLVPNEAGGHVQHRRPAFATASEQYLAPCPRREPQGTRDVPEAPTAEARPPEDLL